MFLYSYSEEQKSNFQRHRPLYLNNLIYFSLSLNQTVSALAWTNTYSLYIYKLYSNSLLYYVFVSYIIDLKIKTK